MKNRQYLFIFILIAFPYSISCNDPSGNSSGMEKESINDTKMDKEKITSFGRLYARAWCSQKPDSVAAFFAGTGSLKVNEDTPAVGREAITKVAKGFMTAFPDIVVVMDSLLITTKGIEFHWTLTGTNSGEGGTGNKVKISGYELWQLNKDGLIEKSLGSFDAIEYNRQLKEGYP